MWVTHEQLVRRADVDEDYVHRLHELGALRGHDDAYGEGDATWLARPTWLLVD